MTTTARSSGHSHPIDECRSIIRTIGTITSPNQLGIILPASAVAGFFSEYEDGRAESCGG
jgi:hypothetical protein